MFEVGPIEVGEIKAVKFDFSGEAGELVTLSSLGVVCTVVKGTDTTPALVLVGTPTIDGKFLIQLVQPGVVGCTYRLRASVSDSAGLKHGMTAHMRVVNG